MNKFHLLLITTVCVRCIVGSPGFETEKVYCSYFEDKSQVRKVYDSYGDAVKLDKNHFAIEEGAKCYADHKHR